MITWWMKLGGNLPPGHDALLFFNKCQGIFHMPSRTDTAAHTKAFAPLHIPYTHAPLGERQSAPARGIFEPPTCRSTVEHTNHQTTMTPARVGGSKPRIINSPSAITAPPRLGHPQGAKRSGIYYMIEEVDRGCGIRPWTHDDPSM